MCESSSRVLQVWRKYQRRFNIDYLFLPFVESTSVNLYVFCETFDYITRLEKVCAIVSELQQI